MRYVLKELLLLMFLCSISALAVGKAAALDGLVSSWNDP